VSFEFFLQQKARLPKRIFEKSPWQWQVMTLAAVLRGVSPASVPPWLPWLWTRPCGLRVCGGHHPPPDPMTRWFLMNTGHPPSCDTTPSIFRVAPATADCFVPFPWGAEVAPAMDASVGGDAAASPINDDQPDPDPKTVGGGSPYGGEREFPPLWWKELARCGCALFCLPAIYGY